jgi:DNA-binding NarL/FixJ family response regulator
MTNRVLIITADALVAKDLEYALGQGGGGQFFVQRVSHLSEAIERLRIGGFDAIMTDLSLPDSEGIETFDKLFAIAPHIPIIKAIYRKPTLAAIWFDKRCVTVSGVRPLKKSFS